MTETDDAVARRIADRGRDALLERLRPAFEEAAQAHADLIQLDDDQLEEMVQRAVERADGLQWRRALASVATEELGIGLGEALSHPAVAQAQSILGAPSYEQSLAELTAARDRPPAHGGGQDSEPEVVSEDEKVSEPEVVSEDAEELAVAEAEATVEVAEHEEVEARRSEPDVRVTATHVARLASRTPDESGLE